MHEVHAAPAFAGHAKTERVSVSSAGVQGDGHSFSPSISADGRLRRLPVARHHPARQRHQRVRRRVRGARVLPGEIRPLKDTRSDIGAEYAPSD